MTTSVLKQRTLPCPVVNICTLLIPICPCAENYIIFGIHMTTGIMLFPKPVLSLSVDISAYELVRKYVCMNTHISY